uniref:Uncharacterized protein n=1 Tax=Anopheles minimus TaxID=112268 RepID=A0A182VYZ4_9DIPT
MRAIRVLWTIWLLLLVININDGASTRKKTKSVTDADSTVYPDCALESRKEFNRRVRVPDKHISIRLLRYFTFGGILQAISEDTAIPRDGLVTGGASKFQDHSSGRGQGVHAAHIIRVGSINKELKRKHEALNKALENYIGHTQNVDRDLNVWNGVGGAIDRYQSRNLNMLATINFNGALCDNWDNITTLQAAFRQIVDKYVLENLANSDALTQNNLEDIKEKVYMIDACMLFENGTAGYEMVKSGKFVQHYNRKRNRSDVCAVCIYTTNSATDKRTKTERTSDICSSIYEPNKHGSREEFDRRVHEPDQHISARLIRYLRFGGILQAISEKTKIPRDQLVEGGASQFQDQSSGLGQAFHAAHIIRVGAINNKLQKKSPTLNRALQNFIGHTQNVERRVNVWHGVGGIIDRYQSDNLNVLATINFNGLYTDNSDILEKLQTGFRQIVHEFALNNLAKSDEQTKIALKKDNDTVYMVSLCMLFENGNEAYEQVKSGVFIASLEVTMLSVRFVWIVCAVSICVINSATGARKQSEVISDICSSSFTEGQYDTRDEYYRRVRDPEKHISARLVRYFRFGGILQAIAEETEIPRDKLVTGGASQFQDQSSGLGQTIHAAHIIRVGSINNKLQKKSPTLNRALQNYIGHTQNVLRAANAWHGVGGEIDKYQSNQLGVLATIDFAGTLDSNDRRTVETLLTEFRTIIDKYVRDGTHTTDNKKILNADNVIVYCMLPLMLHEEGKAGYDMVKNGDFVTKYDKS